MGDVVDLLSCRVDRGRAPWFGRYVGQLNGWIPSRSVHMPSRWGHRGTSVRVDLNGNSSSEPENKAREAFLAMALIEPDSVFVERGGENRVDGRSFGDLWVVSVFIRHGARTYLATFEDPDAAFAYAGALCGVDFHALVDRGLEAGRRA